MATYVPDAAMGDLGRIVVVQAGFALWKGGRCIAAGRWSDIQRVHVSRLAADPVAIRLAVALTDGTVLEMHEQAPGFAQFLQRASATLAGLVPRDDWQAALLAAPAGDGALLFERPPARRPRLSR